MAEEEEGCFVYTCSQCSTVFSEEKSCYDHMLTHTSELHTAETDTGLVEVSTSSQTTKEHSRNAAMCSPRHCNECKSDSPPTKRHYHKNGPFKCDFCGKSWKLHCDLMSHFITHSDYRPFKCSNCKTEFKRGSHLKRHKRLHCSEKSTKVKCPRCHVDYKEKSLLAQHYQDHHLAADITAAISDQIAKTQFQGSDSESSVPVESSLISTSGELGDMADISVTLLSRYSSEGQDFHKYYLRVGKSCHVINVPEHVDQTGQKLTVNIDGSLVTIHLKGEGNEESITNQPIEFKSENFQDCIQIQQNQKQTQKQKQKQRMEVKIIQSSPQNMKIPTQVWHCDLCKMSFNNAIELKDHATAHDVPHNRKGKKLFSCGLCSQTYREIPSLRTHMKLHSMKNVYACKFCGRVFTRPGLVVLHERIHSGFKPVLCKSCPKTFRTQSLLKRHSMVHSGEKPHPCTVCDKRFPDISCRNAHMRKHHPLAVIPMTRGSPK